MLSKSCAQLSKKAKACTICADTLQHEPRPVFQIHQNAKILIAGQAPGIRVHESGIPFDDASGDRLRDWMAIDKKTFYDPEQIAILPMAFCYPGKGKSGDLAPDKRCAVEWRHSFLEVMKQIQLTLVIGQYAQKWHLQDKMAKTLTETVRKWRSYETTLLPLPHPSPRNNIWLSKNSWYENELLPVLRRRVRRALS